MYSTMSRVGHEDSSSFISSQQQRFTVFSSAPLYSCDAMLFRTFQCKIKRWRLVHSAALLNFQAHSRGELRTSAEQLPSVCSVRSGPVRSDAVRSGSLIAAECECNARDANANARHRHTVQYLYAAHNTVLYCASGPSVVLIASQTHLIHHITRYVGFRKSINRNLRVVSSAFSASAAHSNTQTRKRRDVLCASNRFSQVFLDSDFGLYFRVAPHLYSTCSL